MSRVEETLVIDVERLQYELAQLARFTHVEPSERGTAVTRIVFSPDDLAARAWLKSLACEAGLAVREDAVGNTFCRLEGNEPSLPAVATGSHIDAIPHAGMYDGTVGVLGGLAAVRAIQASGLRPRRAIELILFTSEEPTRSASVVWAAGYCRAISPPNEPTRSLILKIAQANARSASVRTEAGFAGPP